MGASNGLGFCLRGKFVRCNVASRLYLNLFAKMGIMEELLNWCIQRIIIILG